MSYSLSPPQDLQPELAAIRASNRRDFAGPINYFGQIGYGSPTKMRPIERDQCIAPVFEDLWITDGRCGRGMYLGAGPSPLQAPIPTNLAHEATGVRKELVLLETCSVTKNTWQMVPFQVPLPTIAGCVVCGTRSSLC